MVQPPPAVVGSNELTMKQLTQHDSTTACGGLLPESNCVADLLRGTRDFLLHLEVSSQVSR